ncbi:MAG TPA: dipeptidase [Parachlamydiaceae bacterium]|nr:dipeptidase [Parachlamydiaceae bacterium]
MNLELLKKNYDENEVEILKDFFTFLKFQSISSEPEYQSEIKTCCSWLKNYLESMHFKTEIWQSRTGGHPVLFASNSKAGKEQPTLLIYNHYDVQPADPLNLWETPPFEPTVRGENIYARGAQDNKGQCFYTLQALKALLQKDGSLPINIKLCIEGEEECGSHTLSSLLSEKKEALQADYLAIVDLGIKSLETPSITLGIRGIVTMDIEVKGAKSDMHSGSNGGLLYNPNHALVELLASLRDQKGQIAVPGFYEGIEKLKEHDKKLISWDFDEGQYEKSFGASPTGGEIELPALERNWTRPTLEINGISGGYQGSGFKTVIPSVASAKISCRLVPGQDPEKIGTLVADFLKSRAPKGVTVTVNCHPGGGRAMHADPRSKIVQAFKGAYEKVFEKPCQFTYEGASIPIVVELGKAANAEIALVGLGLLDDNIHAPNERFGKKRLKKGFLIMADAICHLKA